MSGSGYFTDPQQPHSVYLRVHDHEWVEAGALLNPNGTWSSLWTCAVCPDVGIGGKVGPIPAGHCPCGWVQHKFPRKRCEDCKRPLTA